MSLTKRQQDVHSWALQGLTNKQIGKRLNLSESTVKFHMGAVLKEFGVQNKAQLIAYNVQAITNPIVPVDIEETPIGWVKINAKGFKGFMYGEDCPDDKWNPVYMRKAK